jgi:hypothetical protein
MHTVRACDAAENFSGFSKTATVTAQVSDSHNAGLPKTELYIDGTPVTNSTSGSLPLSLECERKAVM